MTAQPPAAVVAAARSRALGLLLAGSTLSVMAGAVLAPVVELIRTEQRLSATAAGLVLTAHGFSLALAGPAVGWTIDRWGARRPLSLGLLLYGLAGGAGAVVDSYPMLILTRLLFGVGAAFVFTGTTVELLNRYEGALRERVMGWRSTAISLGGAAFPLVGGALGALSWRAPFAAYLLAVPLALLTWHLPGHAASRPAVPGAGRNPWSALATRPRLLGVYALQAVVAALLYAVLVFLPVRLAELGVTDTVVVALFAATLSGVMSAVGLGYGRLRTRISHSGLLRAAFAAWTLAALTIALAPTPVVPLLGAALFGLGMGVAIPTLTVMTGDHAPPGLMGQATALLATATFAGQFAAPLVFGPIQAATSTPATFHAAAAVAGATALALLGYRLRRSRAR